MAGFHTRLDGKGSNTRQVVPPDRVMQLRETTFQIIKEHSYHYYSTATYDEILINLVEFYESNDGPSHKQDD